MRRFVWLSMVFSTLLAVVTPAQAMPVLQADTGIEARVADIQRNKPTWQDDFETVTTPGFWSEAADDDAERFFEDGAYQIVVNEADMIAWSLAGKLAYEDFLVSVDAAAASGSGDSRIGIVFRYQDQENFYLYSISSDGYYLLSRLAQDEWTRLIRWRPSDAIDTSDGAWNSLALLVEDGSFSLLANDQLLATYEDDDSYVGKIGLLAGAFDDDGAQVAFDDFSVWDLRNLSAAEPTPTAAPVARRTPQATPDTGVELQLDQIRANKPLRYDDFRSNTAVWRAGRDDTSARFIKDGQLHIRVSSAKTLAWAGPTDSEALGDFLLEVKVTDVAGPLDNDMGVVFRMEDGNFYYFRISGDGYYGLSRYKDSQWESLIKWTRSEAVKRGIGSRNVLGVLASGPSLTLLVNDVVLATVSDRSLAKGVFALAVGTQEEPNVEAAFDDLYIWRLGRSEPAPTATSTVKPVTVTDATPTPAPTPLPDARRLLGNMRDAAPAFSDEFRRSDSGWGITATGQVTITYADRRLLFQLDKLNWLAWSYNSTIRKLAPVDFLLEVDVQHLKGPANQGYGVVFGHQDSDNYYRFFITKDGFFALQKMEKGQFAALTAWARTPALVTADRGVNRLGLLVRGKEIIAMANDQVLAQVSDAALVPGGLGLVASTSDTPGLEVAFDNLDLWMLEGRAPASAPSTPGSKP